ncbi:MAG: acetoacetate--CoA ligase [Polyangiaceae bacterium]|nr:acetoacetate--CoA ligase [Polyangiaceae bacterium]MCW5790617.1 acetoacetate--CoA ligase [Polyangiaceae bacterium]
MTDLEVTREGELLWEPSAATLESARLTDYLRWLRVERGLDFDDYQALHAWSVGEVEAFWASIAEYFEVRMVADGADPGAPPLDASYFRSASREAVLTQREMPGAEWFPGVTLNYAEHALRERSERLAVIYEDEAGAVTELSFAALAERVRRARAGLRRLGVARGDRVVAYLPNHVEALVAFLAAASLGAVWSSASPEFGVKSVLDRFAQIEPKVLLAVDEYVYGGRRFDRREELAQIRAGLVSLQHSVVVRRGNTEAPEGWLDFEEVLGHGGTASVSATDERSEREPLDFERVPFGHPLYILYSSGTTGLPKPIVHGHGGILLEHLKSLALHCDLGPKDRFFWFSTTGWMMWNYLVSGLCVGAAVVLYEGSPGHPDLGRLWRLAEAHQVTYFGTSAPYLIACRKAGLRPGQEVDLSRLRGLGSTGAPLPADGFGWVYREVSEHVLLGSVSGGTDVCTAFVGSCPLLPVHAGEIQCAELGAWVEAWGPSAEPVIDEVGELVLRAPMPSMPVGFFGDASGERYREAYFSTFQGVWRHGDWIKLTPRGSCVIYGRSDSTLNRGGVRMGTSEFYRVVDGFSELADSLVVDTGTLEQEGELWLFVVLAPGQELTEELAARLKRALRTELSPRHVPDRLIPVADVPRTISGKKLEVPIKRLLAGAPRERVINPGTLANPSAVDAVLAAARGA